MLYCNTATIAATWREGAGGARAGRPGSRQAQAGRAQAAGGRWAQAHARASGRQARGARGKARQGVERAGALKADGRAGYAVGARGARDMSGRRTGARAAARPCWPATRPRGGLRHGHGCCDTAPVPGHARPGRGLGAGGVCWLGQLGQVGALYTWLSSDSVFGPGSTRYFPESLNEHCSL